MAVKQISLAALAPIDSIVSTTAGTAASGIKVNWDNAVVSRHDVAVTLQNIADAILIEEQVTF